VAAIRIWASSESGYSAIGASIWSSSCWLNDTTGSVGGASCAKAPYGIITKIMIPIRTRVKAVFPGIISSRLKIDIGSLTAQPDLI
jgi:hypothetical protein